MDNDFRSIDILVNDEDADEYAGTAEGYVVNTSEENMENYLTWHGYGGCVQSLREQFKRIAVFSSLFVEEEFRGQGYGNQLVDEFIDKAIDEYDAQAVVLIADTGESNEFDIVEFYKCFGFTVISNDRREPLMLYDHTKD